MIILCKSFCRFFLRVLVDLASSGCGQFGIAIVLSTRAARALLDWIPVNSCMCTVLLNDFVRVNSSRLKRRCLFVVSVHAPIDCSSSDDEIRVLPGVISFNPQCAFKGRCGRCQRF